MKFISKSSNLLIVLRPGLSAQPLTGTPAKATISVRFKDGVADVQQLELVEMMLAHPGYNGDFISADTVAVDPYALTRQPSEPAHVLTEMKFGTPVSRSVKGGTPNLSPEIQKMVQAMAADMAKSMLPSMVEGTIKALMADRDSAKKSTGVKVKGKPGRKPKVKAAEPVLATPTETENPLMQGAVS
jgi:hypothetical protein